jgi:hypothetical protein
MVKEKRGRWGSTFLSSADAFDADEEFWFVDVVAAVCEALERHQPLQNARVFAVEWPLELSTVVAVLVNHEVAISLAFGKYAREHWRATRCEAVVLRAIRHMYRPQRNQLSQSDGIDRVGIPKSHSENARVVCNLDLVAALGCCMLLAGFGDAIEVHDTAHECEVTRAGLETAEIGFFIVKRGLWVSQILEW